MDLRPATDRDIDAICRLLNALLATTTIEWTETSKTVQSTRAWLDDHHTVLVAEDDGEVVGVAAYGWFRDATVRPGYRFTVENTIHVRRDHWGTGLAQVLMEALIADAKAHDIHVMVAAIDASNEVSLRFHTQLGFIEVARMPEVGAKFGRWLTLVLLQLRLDDRPEPPDDAHHTRATATEP